MTTTSMTIKTWQTRIAESNQRMPQGMAMQTEIDDLRGENEALLKANIYCTDNFNAMFCELETVKKQLAEQTELAKTTWEQLEVRQRIIDELLAKIESYESQQPAAHVVHVNEKGWPEIDWVWPQETAPIVGMPLYLGKGAKQ